MVQRLCVDTAHRFGSDPNEVNHIVFCHYIDGGERRGQSERDLIQGCVDREHGRKGLLDTEVPSRCLCLS